MTEFWEIKATEKEEFKFLRPELLFHPNIPKPLHGMNPRSILGRNWWDMMRFEAYKKNSYCCWACGIHKSNAKYYRWLEGHEHYDINYSTGCVKLLEIVALCHSCHNYIHDGRMRMMVDSGKMEYSKYKDILFHGKKITHNIKKPNLSFVSKVMLKIKKAKWDEYHLLLNGKKYYSKFKDIYDWQRFYS